MHLSRLSYFGDFILAPALAVVLAWIVLHGRDWTAVGYWGLAMIGGFLFWTFAEYVIHRSIYHHVQPFQHYHDAHHDDPKALIGAPSLIGIILILALVFVPLLPFGLLTAGGVTGGVALGYFAYMSVHHADHHWDLRPGTYLYSLRMHHARHHYAHELGNFGIITPFWDHVFGTVVEKRRRTAER
jgi:sterol desaturase/sphingolipid hydroxylase (fatty acid hydroxylase superfamily)